VTELVLLVVTVLATGILVGPGLRRVPLPAWLARARERGRPGVPVSAWFVAGGLMGLCWLVGEQRGLAGLLLLLVWVGAPVMATGISALWLRRERVT
jgi:hypothetical protein